MDDRSVADYFVIAGLPENPEPVDEDFCEGLNPNEKNIEPITDITVIFPGLGDLVPKGFSCVEITPNGFPANLNSGSLRSPEVYLCYRRGRDKPPLVDIGVMYDGKERLLPDAEVVISTPTGRPANVNNANARIFLTFRRASENMSCNELVVTDICVILQNKGEKPPHAFCLIPKTLNKGMMGGEVYICYKKSMFRPPLISYKPEVLFRYPPIDRRSFPFPNSVAMFCLPMCCTIEVWPSNANQPRAVFSTFVLTVADATEKIYGAAVTFYENHSIEKLNQVEISDLRVELGEDKTVNVNKCICLLSHYPFFDCFKSYLLYLYTKSRTGPQSISIEKYISQLFDEVPFPNTQRPHIFYQISPTHHVLISHLMDSPLPKCGASFRNLLNNLGSDNCLLILLLLLTEQKILVHSLRPDVLTSIVEALAVMIFPFHWQCPYIPLCPLGLSAVLQAPVPFLIGVDSRFFDLYEPPCDVTCIDLDTKTISVSEDKKYLNLKLLPKKASRTLKQSLDIYMEKMYTMSQQNPSIRKRSTIPDVLEIPDLDLQIKKRERLIELEIQDAFLRFTTTILKGYRSYLLPITREPTEGATNASSLFDFQAFLRSRDKNYHKFYQLMLKTQLFFRFIEERSFVSDIDTGLAFFDECVDKIEQDHDHDTVKLVDFSEGSQGSDRTVFIMMPEKDEDNDIEYDYKSIFKLDEGLFKSVKLKSNSLDRVQNQFFSTPGSPSPIARRTKQEIKSAQKIARKNVDTPIKWSKFLLSTCYSLWFIHLPSYVSQAPSKQRALHHSYDMLVRMTKNRLQADEICYRVVMQLCGTYSQPMIAVKALFEMKRGGMTPNAITYGYYNKAVLEATWPSNVKNSSQLMWNKLRNVIIGVAQFRAAGKRKQASNLTIDEGDDKISNGSAGSLESQKMVNNQNNKTNGQNSPTRISSSSDMGYGSLKVDDEEQQKATMGKLWYNRIGKSIDTWVKSGVSSLSAIASTETGFYSPAGLLMSGDFRGDYVNEQEEHYTNNDDEDEANESQHTPRPRQSSIPTSNSTINSNKTSHRKLDFDNIDGIGDGNQKQQEQKVESETTLRMLRSVSFGNDKQIMSKLKEEMNIKNNNDNQNQQAESKKEKLSIDEKLENKVAQVQLFFEGDTSRENSVEKSREVTPLQEVEEDEDTPLTMTLKFDESDENKSIEPPRSPSIQIKHSRSAELCQLKENGSPARTPVTTNDPLGALIESTDNKLNKDSPKRTASEGHILDMSSSSSCEKKRSERFVKSSTIDRSDGVPTNPHDGGVTKLFHRSSTLPNYSSMCPGAGSSGGSTPGDDNKLTSCVGPSSSFTGLKNSFTRYSPGRMSLKKAGSLLESTFGGKKAEQLMEGLNQFTAVAAVTVKKKFGEVKEAIGTNANTTPIGKNSPFGRYYDDIRPKDSTDSSSIPEWNDENQIQPPQSTDVNDQWSAVSESYLENILLNSSEAAILSSTGSNRASFASVDININNVGRLLPNHPDNSLTSSTQSLLLPDLNLKLTKQLDVVIAGGGSGKSFGGQPIGIEIEMTTASMCHNCNCILFDEEIMAGWTPEDSNLNSKCPHCKKPEVPFLDITIFDYRYYPVSTVVKSQCAHLNDPLNSALSVESMQTSSRRPSVLVGVGVGSGHSSNKLNTVANSEGNLTPKKSQQDTSVGLNSSEVYEVSNCINGELASPSELDPLGVLETQKQQERSRRTSPELEKPPISTSIPTIEDPVNCSDTRTEDKTETVEREIVEPLKLSPIIVPYLSPLVLRKELENVLELEGDPTLTASKFVDEHPIIYWNLVWYFSRANLSSHLRGLCLNAESIKSDLANNKSSSEKGENDVSSVHPSWSSADYRNVQIKCKWDNQRFHSTLCVPPLYIQYLQQLEKKKEKEKEVVEDGEVTIVAEEDSSKLIADVIRSVQRGELQLVCPKLLYYYHKQQNKGKHFPTYRDILFLAITALGKDTYDLYGFGFDRDYRNVYSRLTNNDEYESMDLGDMPPADAALFCRRFFRDLQL